MDGQPEAWHLRNRQMASQKSKSEKPMDGQPEAWHLRNRQMAKQKPDRSEKCMDGQPEAWGQRKLWMANLKTGLWRQQFRNSYWTDDSWGWHLKEEEESETHLHFFFKSQPIGKPYFKTPSCLQAPQQTHHRWHYTSMPLPRMQLLNVPLTGLHNTLFLPNEKQTPT